MNKTIFLFVLLIISTMVKGQTKNFLDQAYLETRATVDTLVTPDRIYLSIFISESDTKGKNTVEELEQNMAKKLKEIGIDVTKQLTLTDLSSNFRKYFLRKQDIWKAKSYELEVYDAKTAGRVIYEMEGIGISNVDLERTEFSKIEELKLALLTKALAKAKQQAEAMLNPLNQTVGNVLYISDLRSGIPDVAAAYEIIAKGYVASKSNYDAIPIEFEKIKVERRVDVKFSISAK